MELVKQPTHNTCIIACLAMLSGKDVSSLFPIHEAIWSGAPVHDALTSLGIVWKAQHRSDTRLQAGRVYLATVPSLTLLGSFHQVLLDCREENLILLDPASCQGRPYYTVDDPIDGDAVPLTSWILDYEVIPHD